MVSHQSVGGTSDTQLFCSIVASLALGPEPQCQPIEKKCVKSSNSKDTIRYQTHEYSLNRVVRIQVSGLKRFYALDGLFGVDGWLKGRWGEVETSCSTAYFLFI